MPLAASPRSLKMKMSILLGVAHMNLGIVMSLLNNNYFRCGRRLGTRRPLQGLSYA